MNENKEKMVVVQKKNQRENERDGKTKKGGNGVARKTVRMAMMMRVQREK